MTTMSNQRQTPVVVPQWTKFLASGLGGTMGWLPVHPFDLAKVRMQIDETSSTKPSQSNNTNNLSKSIPKSSTNPANVIQKRSLLSTLGTIVKTEGVLGMYKGLSAAVTRQMTYTTLRLGLYDVFRTNIIQYRNKSISDSNTNTNNTFKNDNNRHNNNTKNTNNTNNNKSENITLMDKLICGLTAGGIAATICNPVEVALVRMQADGAQKDLKLKRNYKNVFDAWARVTREEGFITLYRGVRPTVARGMVVSCVQLASYDQAKTMISNLNILQNDGPLLHFSASLVSGYLYCLASLPLDICKTRMQNQHKTIVSASVSGSGSGNVGAGASMALSSDGLMYKSIPQTMYKIISNEGVFALWKGFIPYFARGGGHTICMFLCVEQIKKQINNHYS